MSLTGVHVACGFVGGAGRRGGIQSLLSKVAWSQTMAAATTTTAVAPSASGELGDPSFEIRASIDVYVAVGAAPDAGQVTSSSSSSARILVPASETRNIFCSSGDKLAWVAV